MNLHRNAAFDGLSGGALVEFDSVNVVVLILDESGELAAAQVEHALSAPDGFQQISAPRGNLEERIVEPRLAVPLRT